MIVIFFIYYIFLITILLKRTLTKKQTLCHKGTIKKYVSFLPERQIWRHICHVLYIDYLPLSIKKSKLL